MIHDDTSNDELYMFKILTTYLILIDKNFYVLYELISVFFFIKKKVLISVLGCANFSVIMKSLFTPPIK